MLIVSQGLPIKVIMKNYANLDDYDYLKFIQTFFLISDKTVSNETVNDLILAKSKYPMNYIAHIFVLPR